MTRDELREQVARAMCQEKCAFYGDPPCWGLDPAEYVIEPWNPDKCDEPGCGALADAAIAIVRAATLEDAAKVADHHAETTNWIDGHYEAKDIAAAIRALAKGEK